MIKPNVDQLYGLQYKLGTTFTVHFHSSHLPYTNHMGLSPLAPTLIQALYAMNKYITMEIER